LPFRSVNVSSLYRPSVVLAGSSRKTEGLAHTFFPFALSLVDETSTGLSYFTRLSTGGIILRVFPDPPHLPCPLLSLQQLVLALDPHAYASPQHPHPFQTAPGFSPGLQLTPQVNVTPSRRPPTTNCLNTPLSPGQTRLKKTGQKRLVLH